ncbi:alpha/beta hydrolase [Paenibacillus larvae]|uniref:Endo-1,4-beta-xylanase Z n=1 Tax=Paenibacillus larvae subsp. larvae TaxID=147375 RepID=A0A6C0QWL4_9BACL|nr:alpha/beta hydrolase-fold protein [Paenibacillus larvae]QHZ52857.1 Endo-1,4-beta-xylanase Z precursor [Paenibacillus larvae subsp. larvae]
MTDSKYYKRTILKEELHSEYLQETRSLRVYLPPGYNELLSYPVIYCQDGEQFFNFGRIATSMNQAIFDDSLEPAIIVGVDVKLATRTAEYSRNGNKHQAYLQFFTSELLPYIEEKYSIRQTKDERIVAGDSLGGTVSLHLALDYPDLFSNVLSFSGALYEITRQQLAASGDLSWLNLYMIIGLDELAVETDHGTFNFLEENRLTHELLKQKGTRLFYEEKPGKHLWGFWQKEIPAALRHFLG